MNFQDFIVEDRRLFILRLLKECGGEANESVIENACHAAGHSRGVTRDVIRADVAWLKERSLVLDAWYEDIILVAQITKRGVSVAKGHLVVEGVKRPSIGV